MGGVSEHTSRLRGLFPPLSPKALSLSLSTFLFHFLFFNFLDFLFPHWTGLDRVAFSPSAPPAKSHRSTNSPTAVDRRNLSPGSRLQPRKLPLQSRLPKTRNAAAKAVAAAAVGAVVGNRTLSFLSSQSRTMGRTQK